MCKQKLRGFSDDKSSYIREVLIPEINKKNKVICEKTKLIRAIRGSLIRTLQNYDKFITGGTWFSGDTEMED